MVGSLCSFIDTSDLMRTGTTPGYGGSGNTHSARTNFYELNKVIEMAKSHLPNNQWLKNRLRVNLNINDSCVSI
jgi:hypothetical protein